ncbi:hypothetical protein HHI36_019899 [Cryptolaemus montrouzieri]|uniref:Uncharacterized protein n=1 Tax=Cryptolaemus montrouzieri TaxID=559131 RepID=A0ABD2N8P6_9CUCU
MKEQSTNHGAHTQTASGASSRTVKDHREESINLNEKWKTMTHRRTPIKGCKVIPNSTLNVAEQFSWLFVSGLSTDTTTDDLINYVKENHKNCTCEKLKTEKDDVYSSFCLGVARDDRVEMRDTQFWPTGGLISDDPTSEHEKPQEQKHLS